jgi:hypothetical protein
VGSCNNSFRLNDIREESGRKAPGEAMDLEIKILLVEDNLDRNKARAKTQ